MGQHVVTPVQFMIFELSTKPTENTKSFTGALAKGSAIHVFSQDPDGLLAPEILISEEQRLSLTPISGGILYLLANGFGAGGAYASGDGRG
jgi:hypothetical protein